MQIKEVCNLCGLTKKAVEYYESQGLITPTVLENGYRDYGGAQVAALKEIAVLRRLDISISDIRDVLRSPDKASALTRCQQQNDAKMRQLQCNQHGISQLIVNYDIDACYKQLDADAKHLSMRERLCLAFPGNYGLYLSLHFGRFLDAPIETPQAQAAYDAIIAWLDDVKTQIPDELAEYIQSVFPQDPAFDIERFENNVSAAMESMLDNPASLSGSMDVEAYIQYRTSDAFWQSPAGKMTTLMTAFQQSSGYQTVFIENLKMVSPKYRRYQEKLEMANAAFLAQYPDAAKFYEGRHTA